MKGRNYEKPIVLVDEAATGGPTSIVVLRLMAGGVFLWEGILKFVYANQGVGRFTKLGMPFPHLTANFVAGVEIVGGLLLLSGLMTRLIAIPLIIEMIVAMLSTKISLYFGVSLLPPPPAPPLMGMWAVLHEIRSEYAQLLTTVFLLINGPGHWSLDALFEEWRNSRLRFERYPAQRWTISLPDLRKQPLTDYRVMSCVRPAL